MQEKVTIARPYAQAAFEVAREEGTLDQWSALIECLGIVVSDPLMRAVISNPKLDEARLATLVTELCGDTVFDSGRNFIRILVDADRLDVAPEIHDLFESKKAREIGLSQVSVTTAWELSEEQQSAIRDVMSKRLGTRIEISSEVDSSLIGGAIIRAGDSVIDVSLRGRLNDLTNEFAS